MSEPFYDHRLDPEAFPPLLRAVSAVLTVAIVGVLVLQALFETSPGLA
jgi:hypothetical protein